MTVTEIADEVQAQLLSAVQTVQEGVVSTLEWVSEQAETRLPGVGRPPGQPPSGGDALHRPWLRRRRAVPALAARLRHEDRRRAEAVGLSPSG